MHRTGLSGLVAGGAAGGKGVVVVAGENVAGRETESCSRGGASGPKVGVEFGLFF